MPTVTGKMNRRVNKKCRLNRGNPTITAKMNRRVSAKMLLRRG